MNFKNNFFNRLNYLDNNFSKEDIEKLSKNSFKRFSKELDNFCKNEKPNREEKYKMLRKDIREMILNIDNRIHYWENRRTQYLQLATAILAASIIGIITTFQKISLFQNLCDLQSIAYMIILIPCLILFLGSIYLLNVWNKQNNPNYPFVKIPRIWRWHYRHAEKNSIDTNISKYNSQKYKTQIDIFIDNLENYGIKTLKADYKELLDQDISQLFLLITNEKFKIKFVTHLRDCFYKILSVSIYSFVILIIIYILNLIFSDNSVFVDQALTLYKRVFGL